MSLWTCSRDCVRSVSCDPLWDVDRGPWGQGPYVRPQLLLQPPSSPYRPHGLDNVPQLANMKLSGSPIGSRVRGYNPLPALSVQAQADGRLLSEQ